MPRNLPEYHAEIRIFGIDTGGRDAYEPSRLRQVARGIYSATDISAPSRENQIKALLVEALEADKCAEGRYVATCTFGDLSGSVHCFDVTRNPNPVWVIT